MCTRDDCDHPFGEEQDKVDWMESRFDDPIESMMYGGNLDPMDDWVEDLGILGEQELD